MCNLGNRMSHGLVSKHLHQYWKWTFTVSLISGFMLPLFCFFSHHGVAALFPPKMFFSVVSVAVEPFNQNTWEREGGGTMCMSTSHPCNLVTVAPTPISYKTEARVGDSSAKSTPSRRQNIPLLRWVISLHSYLFSSHIDFFPVILCLMMDKNIFMYRKGRTIPHPRINAIGSLCSFSWFC